MCLWSLSGVGDQPPPLPMCLLAWLSPAPLVSCRSQVVRCVVMVAAAGALVGVVMAGRRAVRSWGLTRSNTLHPDGSGEQRYTRVIGYYEPS